MRFWIVIAISLLSCAPSSGGSGRTRAEQGLKWRLPPLAREVHLADLPVRPMTDCPGYGRATVEHARIAIAIDTSLSTIGPVDADINANGYVGSPMFVEMTNGTFTGRSTDLGDTVIAAEVSGSRSLVHAIAGPGTPISLIAFSGPPGTSEIVAPLSTDLASLEQGFQRILVTGSIGSTDLAEAISLARASLALSPQTSAGETNDIVLLISDSPSPSRQDDSVIQEAAARASGEGVVIHTFAVTRSRRDTPGLLGQIADLTGGTFHHVSEPTDLHCALAASLNP